MNPNSQILNNIIKKKRKTLMEKIVHKNHKIMNNGLIIVQKRLSNQNMTKNVMLKHYGDWHSLI